MARTEIPNTGSIADLLLERLSNGKLKLPLLPEVAHQVTSMVSDESCDASRLSALIHRDQSLAGHVLRVANSPVYAGSSRIVSLQQAVARLGSTTVRDIVMSIALRAGIFSIPECKTVLKSLWREALATATFARALSGVRKSNAETSFLCGLLHQIGKPIVLQALRDVAKEVGERPPVDLQVQIANALHCEFGSEVAHRWRLPLQICECIEFSGRYKDAPSFVEEVATTYLANQFARHLLDAEDVTEDEILSLEVCTDLDLKPQDVRSIFDMMDDVRETVATLQL